MVNRHYPPAVGMGEITDRHNAAYSRPVHTLPTIELPTVLERPHEKDFGQIHYIDVVPGCNA
jgi:hypothetical protein